MSMLLWYNIYLLYESIFLLILTQTHTIRLHIQKSSVNYNYNIFFALNRIQNLIYPYQIKYDAHYRFWKTELPFDELEKSIAGLKTLTIGETSIEDTSVGDSGTELTDGPEVCSIVYLSLLHLFCAKSVVLGGWVEL